MTIYLLKLNTRFCQPDATQTKCDGGDLVPF